MMVRVFTIAIYVFLLLLAAPTVLANGGAAAEEGFAHGFEHMGIGGWIIIPILFMILMMVFMRGGPMRGMMRGHGSHDEDKQKNNKTALDVLKERYAKGEIDKVFTNNPNNYGNNYFRNKYQQLNPHLIK